MKDFLRFKKMLTPVFIEIIFWIASVVGMFGGLATVIRGLGMRYGGGGVVLGGLVMMIVAPLVVRIWCELMLVIFKIHESLVQVEKNTAK